MRLCIDFETRSQCDLKACGAWVYAAHPTTEVICLAALPDNEDEAIYWVPPNIAGILGIETEPARLFALFAQADEIEAHNLEFERAIWTMCCQKKYGWPTPPVHKFRCSAAKASMHSLPRALGKACSALGLSEQKDSAGYVLMMKMCKPRKPSKAELAERNKPVGDDAASILSFVFEDQPPTPSLFWIEDRDSLTRLINYCIQDVRSERELSLNLRDLPPLEQRIWALDQTINARGIMADVATAARMVKAVEGYADEMTAEFQELTGGLAEKPSQRDATLEVLGAFGVDMDDLQKGSVATELEGEDMDPIGRRILEIRQALSMSSTAKYSSILKRASADGRIRGHLLYWGAQTGRWSGRGTQLQNLPRGTFPDAESCIDYFNGYGLDAMEALWGDPMAAASTCVRGMFMAAPGHDLIAADYSAIEARVIAWMAGEEHVLAAFREGLDLYKVAAMAVFDMDYDEITKEGGERQIGKVVVLACGYRGHVGAFQSMAALYKVVVTDERAAEIVDTWRKKHPATVRLWRGLEEAAVMAVLEPGKVYEYRNIKFKLEGRFLLMRLPSGRYVFYCDPAVSKETMWKWETETAEGEPGLPVGGMADLESDALIIAQKKAKKKKLTIMGTGQSWQKNVLTYWSVDSMTKRWQKTPTYGGKLTENAVQAASRDLMAEAMLRLEAAGYPIVLTVHDEVVAEVPEGFGSLAEFERIMSVVPAWAAGCPIQAKGWRGKRFRK